MRKALPFLGKVPSYAAMGAIVAAGLVVISVGALVGAAGRILAELGSLFVEAVVSAYEAFD